MGEYPKIDGHRRHYIHYPVQNKHGKWESVDVYIDGKGGHSRLLNEVRTKFDNREDCMKGCEIHNRYHGWSDELVVDVVNISMSL